VWVRFPLLVAPKLASAFRLVENTNSIFVVTPKVRDHVVNIKEPWYKNCQRVFIF